MTAHQLRSRNWFGRSDLDGFVHRSWLKAEGFSDVVFDGRPVVGIANSWSELTNGNTHLRQVADAVKRGVWSAGGFPLEFPTISLGEVHSGSVPRHRRPVARLIRSPTSPAEQKIPTHWRNSCRFIPESLGWTDIYIRYFK
jgi:dihydroxyacid dehydratase/phosphogluconate dehydratase